MREADARAILDTKGWLARMPAEFRAALLDLCVWKRYRAHQPIYAAGDPPGGVYGIAQGAISYTVAIGRADSPAMHLGRAAIWTGVGPLISGEPRRASIVAAEPALAAYAPLPALQAMLSARPAWWRHFAQQLLMEFDTATAVANDLMIRSAARRCAATLLRLAASRFETPAEGSAPEVRITQETLSAMTNLSRGSLSPILKTLAGRGVIATGHGVIRFLDIPGLRAIADAE